MLIALVSMRSSRLKTAVYTMQYGRQFIQSWQMMQRAGTATVGTTPLKKPLVETLSFVSTWTHVDVRLLAARSKDGLKNDGL